MWLANLQMAAGKKKDAGVSLRRAVEWAGECGGPWLALVQYHVFLSEKDKAEDVVREVEQKFKGPERALTLAHCHEAVGKTKLAETEYLAVVAASPWDLKPVFQLTGFYERTGTPAKAVDHLRRLYRAKDRLTPADVLSLRRTLALVLARTGAYPQFLEALALVEENLAANAVSAVDLDTKARLLMSQPGGLKKALKLFQDLAKLQPLTPDQEFAVARLQVRLNSWQAARPVLLKLLERAGDNPAYVGYFVDELLQRDELIDAYIWLQRLEQLTAKDEAGTVARRARYLIKEGQYADALAHINRRLPVPAPEEKGRAERLRVKAGLLDQLGREDPEADKRLALSAEKLYKDLAATSGRPQDVFLLAGFLARRKQMDKALDLCEEAKKNCAASEVAVTAAMLVFVAPASDDNLKTVEKWLGDVRAQKPDVWAPRVNLLLGALQARRDRYEDAEKSFRRAVQQNASIDALNNLAYMLVIQRRSLKDLDEAAKLIGKAMADAGPIADLLDTRGMIALAADDVDRAVKDLESAVAQGASPTRQLHLAQAYYRKGKRDKAAQLVEKVAAAGVERSLFLPAERLAYQQLCRDLGLTARK
jgi:tetratricopeptide (TPR) repeat protein